MSLFDALLGRHKVKGPAPDRLFALSTAYVDLDAAHGVKTRGTAGIVFQALATADFQQIITDTQELLAGSGEETGTQVETRDDEYGYRWIVLRDPDIEDLVVAVNTVGDGLAVGGYGDRILAAVFAFEDAQKRPLYLIYNYKRGKWYPFVPGDGEKQRATERELQFKAQIGPALPMEPELERWFPLWGAPI
jgi:hypothetical protein